jgi:hypothetical protein
MSKKSPQAKKRKLSTEGYIKLKKYVSHYHHFSFRNPRKNKEFTSSQKGAITRQFNRLKDHIQRTRLENESFINTTHLKKKDIPQNDGVKTNKGFFFKYPFTHIRKIKLKRGEPAVNILVTDFRLIEKSPLRKGTTSSDVIQIFSVIPESVKQNPEDLANYIESVRDHYQPDFLLTSEYGRKYATRFTPKEFFKYAEETAKEELDEDETDKDSLRKNNKICFFQQVVAGERDIYYALLLGFFKPKPKKI